MAHTQHNRLNNGKAGSYLATGHCVKINESSWKVLESVFREGIEQMKGKLNQEKFYK